MNIFHQPSLLMAAGNSKQPNAAGKTSVSMKRVWWILRVNVTDWLIKREDDKKKKKTCLTLTEGLILWVSSLWCIQTLQITPGACQWNKWAFLVLWTAAFALKDYFAAICFFPGLAGVIHWSDSKTVFFLVISRKV